MQNIGLVCEGGGLRGIYTSGVLDFFTEKQLEFPFVVGVSAGAIFPANYLSKQVKRGLEIQTTYVNDKRYMSFRNILKSGNFFDKEFAYYRMTKELVPFNYDTFKASTKEFKIGAFNCNTGKTDFFSNKKLTTLDEILEALIASSSLPFLSKKLKFKDNLYLDGGIGCPIPINESISSGNKKHLVILTQFEGYKKKPLKHKKIISLFYSKFPHVKEALLNRHNIYNDTMDMLYKLEEEGSVFIIRPSNNMEVGRLEKDTSKITDLYQLGYDDAKNLYSDIIAWAKS